MPGALLALGSPLPTQGGPHAALPLLGGEHGLYHRRDFLGWGWLSTRFPPPPAPRTPYPQPLYQPSLNTPRGSQTLLSDSPLLRDLLEGLSHNARAVGPLATVQDSTRPLRNLPAAPPALPSIFPPEASAALQVARSANDPQWRHTMARLLREFRVYVAGLPPQLTNLPVDALVTWFIAAMPDLEAPSRRNYVHALSRALQDHGEIPGPLSHMPFARAYLLGLNRLYGFAPVRAADRFSPGDLQSWLSLSPAPPLHIQVGVAVAFLGGRRLADICGRLLAREARLEKVRDQWVLHLTFAWQKATLGNLSTSTWISLPPPLLPLVRKLLLTTPPSSPLFPFHPTQAMPFLRQIRPSLSTRSMRTGAASHLVEDPSVSAEDVRALTGHATDRALAQYTRSARPEQLASLATNLSARLFPPSSP